MKRSRQMQGNTLAMKPLLGLPTIESFTANRWVAASIGVTMSPKLLFPPLQYADLVRTRLLSLNLVGQRNIRPEMPQGQNINWQYLKKICTTTKLNVANFHILASAKNLSAIYKSGLACEPVLRGALAAGREKEGEPRAEGNDALHRCSSCCTERLRTCQ